MHSPQTGSAGAAIKQEISAIDPKGTNKEAHAGYAVPFLSQLWHLAGRRNKDNIRNPGIYWVRLAMFVMLCLMIGSMYWDIGNDQNDIQVTTTLLS